LQSEGAQRVELVAGEHHDALWVGRHLGGARRVPDLPGLRTIVEWSRIGRAGFVGPALVPSTLAPATLVVLVITEFAADG